MLLRSSSTPSLTSWFQHQNHKGLSSDFIHRNLKPSTISSSDSPKKITRASSDGDLVCLSLPLRRNSLNSASCLMISCVAVEEGVESDEIESSSLMISGSGTNLDVVEGCEVQVMMDGDGRGGDGGKICNGGGGDNNNNNGGDATDAYYLNMIEADPGNSLILGNYAKYLKEVRGDVLKAEEYCSRAIVANPSDGTALSMYADLIWKTQKNASRAHNYFHQAVKASPHDSYVMAAYARFLWDADADDIDEQDSDVNIVAASKFLHQQFPFATVS